MFVNAPAEKQKPEAVWENLFRKRLDRQMESIMLFFAKAIQKFSLSKVSISPFAKKPDEPENKTKKSCVCHSKSS